MKIYIFGHEPAVVEYLDSSLKNGDSFSLCEDSDKNHHWEKEDAVILISDDVLEVRMMRESILPQMPLLVISKEPLWLDPLEFPLTRSCCQPLSSFEIRKNINMMREIISKSAILEQHVAGVSRDASLLRSNIILASSTDVPVHIYGETGTGKTMAAELIHSLSGRKKELVYINCANLSSSLIDSELFGHHKGAFTSAENSRGGLVRKASDSTLFLDEIGNLPLKTQSKLLDTIENGRFRAVGGDEEFRSDFRLITASHENLEKLVSKGKIRQDFFYRISTLAFTIKPLRDHAEDIPHLVKHFEKIKDVKKSYIREYKPLMERFWRGNVRELNHYLSKVYLFR